MTMYKTWIKTLMGAIAAGALTVSCGDDTDVQKQWESKVIDSEFNEFFTEVFGDIDSEQDFRMVTQRTMNITNVGGDVNTTYTIYVCQGNPNYEDDAMALYQTTAQGQSAVSFKFDAPTGLSHLWVVRSAPNDQVASYVTVYKTAKSINLSLEDDETRAQVSETTVNELTNNLFDFSQVHDISDHTYKMSAPSTVLQDMSYDQSKASGFEFKAESGTFSNLNLYNYCQSFLQEGEDISQTTPCKIYVNGDVTIEPSCTFIFVEFYIPDGSTLTYKGADTKGVRFYVKEGGKLILNTNAINAQYESYPSEIVNEGEVVINGKENTTTEKVMTDTPCTVTFPLNDINDYTKAEATISEGFWGTVTLGNKLSFNQKSRTVKGFSDNIKFLEFKVNESTAKSFSSSEDYSSAVEMSFGYTGDCSFKPTKVTGNISRVGTDKGKIDILLRNKWGGSWDTTPLSLGTGIVPRRSDKTVEGDTESNGKNNYLADCSFSYDIDEDQLKGKNISLYIYVYEMDKDKIIALNNIVLFGIVTQEKTVTKETGDPTFAMSNYCNFYNAGTMTFNCPLTFNSADGNSSPNYFTNYSGATMTGQSVFIGGKGAQFANAGTMTLSSVLELSTGSGGGAQAINTGTMNLAGLSLNTGVTHFYNGGTTIVSGLTESTQSGNTWVNNGYYKTEKLNVNASNVTFYNYCQLIVTDEFYLHEATFNNMSSSYVQASKMDMGNFTFNLWDNAVLYVTDLLSIPEGKGSGSDNGFHGLGSEYALVAAKQVDVLASSSKNIQFLGKVKYAWNSFRYLDENDNELTETQADALAADSYKHIFYADETAQSVSYSELSIKKPDSDECGASEWSHGGGPDPQAYTYTLAYEDLGTKDDFDFNDIVLRVSHTGGTTEGTVQFVAAGGTLKISIAYDGETLFSHTDGVMYATGGSEGNYSISNLPGVKTATIAMKDDFSWTDDNCLSKFTLNVKNDGGDFVKAIPATTQAGYAPQCLVIPSGTWKWPTGRTSIKDAYPQFSAWVADKEANTTWYNYPASGKVYTGN